VKHTVYHVPSVAVSASTLGCTMTWASAKAHCESLGRRLCRASEILDASGKFIFGPMAGDHWTPVLDAENEWVQIGELMGEAGPRQARHGAQFPDKRDQGRVWIKGVQGSDLIRVCSSNEQGKGVLYQIFGLK
jgi:hypothetical protein